MAWLMAALPYIGEGASVVGNMQAGRDALTTSAITARSLDQQAGADVAVSQRRAIEERRQARLVQSRALAVSAGSGADASGPTVEGIVSKIGAEGEYRALNELWAGNETARGVKAQAEAARRGGASAYQASNYRIYGNVLDAGSSLYDKYGDGVATDKRVPAVGYYSNRGNTLYHDESGFNYNIPSGYK